MDAHVSLRKCRPVAVKLDEHCANVDILRSRATVADGIGGGAGGGGRGKASAPQ